MTQPALSVLLPTYNRAAMLDDCLGSLVASTADIEIVVLDNASTDTTPEVTRFYAERDRRVRVIRRSENIGILANLGAAFGEASGRYVTMMGDDDRIHPGNYERKVALLDAEPEIGLVYSLANRMTGSGEIQGPLTWPGIVPHSYLGTRDEFRDLLVACYMSLQSVVFRRELLDRYGHFSDDPDIVAGGADWDMLLRYCYHTRTAFIAEPLVSVRFHADSYSESVARQQTMFAKGRIAIWRHWLVDQPNPPALDLAHWARMRQAFLPDLRHELGNDIAQIEFYLKAFDQIQADNARRQNDVLQAHLARALPAAVATTEPPSWWLLLWQRLLLSPPKQVLCHGFQDARAQEAMAAEGTTLVTQPEALQGLADGLIVHGGAGTEGAAQLADGGLFMALQPAFPDDVIAWRRQIEACFGATVHLVDPEPQCPYLVAFGWKGRQLPADARRAVMSSHRNLLPMDGGGVVLILESLRFLRDHGVITDISIAWRLPMQVYDVVHLHSLWILENQEKLQELATPIVVSTIFYDFQELRYAGAEVQRVFGQNDPAAVTKALDEWAAKGKRIGEAEYAQYAEPNDLRLKQRALLDMAALIMPNAPGEIPILTRAFGPLPAPVHVVTNGVHPERFLHADPQPFIAAYGLKDFVLIVGRVETNKNLIMLIWALRDTGIPIVVVGKPYEATFVGLCKKWAGPNVHFLGGLPPHLLESAFAAAKVHALPSWHELPGLVSLEAALAGCGIVTGNRGTETDYFGDLAFAANPADYRSIREAVLKAMADDSPERIAARKAHIGERHTWRHTAKATRAGYDQVWSKRPRWFLMPDWRDAASWQPALLTYLQTFQPTEKSLLQLYAGPENGMTIQAAHELVMAWLPNQPVDLEAIPGIEITDVVPQNQTTWAIDTGKPGVLTGFGERVVDQAGWQAFCLGHRP